MITLKERFGWPAARLCVPLLVVLCTRSGAAVDFPGPAPREARAQVDQDRFVLENQVLACKWTLADGRLKPLCVLDKLSGETLELAGAESFSLLVAQSPSPQARLIKASELKAVGAPRLAEIRGDPTSRRLADAFGGRQVSVELVSPDGTLEVQWKAVLRDGANYVRQHVRIRAKEEPVELRELVLAELPVPEAEVVGSVDGSPVVAGNLFFAYEHPMSRSAVLAGEGAEGEEEEEEEQEQEQEEAARAAGESAPAKEPAPGSRKLVRCRYPYSVIVRPDGPLEHTFTIGVTPEGQLRRGFLYYLERERAQPYRPFLHHSCGYQVGCEFWRLRRYGAPGEWEQFVGRQEKLWLKLIDVFGRELVQKRDVVLDSFVHDHGWDDVSVVWVFHQGYPRGFAAERAAAQRYGSAVGVWLSPWGGYSGRALRVEAGQRQGFETTKNGLTLAGPRYYARVRAACTGMVRDYGVNYFKFDGFGAGNNQPGAGPYASDVEALLRLCGELRRLQPDVFLNPTTGTWPSPFWLLWADAIWRQESDAGFLGEGSDRQQWLTYRDNATYHSTIQRGPLYPISSLMLHGIMVHKFAFKNPYDPARPGVSCHPDDMVAEIRSYFATGTNLQELHIDPSLMTERTWDVLAESARWSRSNRRVLADTHWIGGDPAQGEVYGWASWSQEKAILSLRNPNAEPAEITLDVAEAFELPAGAPQKYALRSPWAEDAGRPVIAVQAGRPHTFRLEPFEVLVLDTIP
jgi:hypothetical protein